MKKNYILTANEAALYESSREARETAFVIKPVFAAILARSIARAAAKSSQQNAQVAK